MADGHRKRVIHYELQRNAFGNWLIHYPCPGCRHPLKSPSRDAGQNDVCPECGAQFILPEQASAEAEFKERQRRLAKDHDQIQRQKQKAARQQATAEERRQREEAERHERMLEEQKRRREAEQAQEHFEAHRHQIEMSAGVRRRSYPALLYVAAAIMWSAYVTLFEGVVGIGFLVFVWVRIEMEDGPFPPFFPYGLITATVLAGALISYCIFVYAAAELIRLAVNVSQRTDELSEYQRRTAILIAEMADRDMEYD